MKYLIIALLLYSCSPLRHYTKVANDPFRNSAERALLARAAQQEFPAIEDTGRVIYTGVDSAEYKALNMAHLQLLDSLIAHYEREDTLSWVPETENPPALQSMIDAAFNEVAKVDSLRHIRNFLRTYRPPTITRTEVKEVKVRDAAWAELKQQEINACKLENEQLTKRTQIAEEKASNRGGTQWWLICLCVILGGWHLVNIFKRGGIT